MVSELKTGTYNKSLSFPEENLNPETQNIPGQSAYLIPLERNESILLHSRLVCLPKMFLSS